MATKTGQYSSVDELPDLLAKNTDYKSVDELPDLKKKSGGVASSTGGTVGNSNPPSVNSTNPFAIGGQYNQPPKLEVDKLDFSNERKNAAIAEQIKTPLKKIPLTPILDNPIPKPISEIDAKEAIARQQQHKADMETAIDNTTLKVLKQKGIVAGKGSPYYERERKAIEEKTKPTTIGGIVVAGPEATYHKDKNGNIGLDRNLGFLEDVRKGFNDAVNGEEEADAFSAMDTKQKVDYANQKMQEKPPTEYMEERSGVGGLLGGAVPYMTKAAAAATLATAAGILAPETGGTSLVGLTPVLTVLLTAPDMIKQGAKDEIMARYMQLKQERPEADEVELMSIAEQGELSGSLLGAANALAFTTTLKLPIASESKNVLKQYLNGVASSAVHLGGITAGGKAAQLAERKLEGYNVNTDKAIDEITTTFTDNATAGAILNGLISGVHTLPKVVKSAFKFALKDTPTAEIKTALDANVQAGRIPPEVAEQTVADIQGYKDALAKTSDGLKPETQASVAGLIQARDNVVAEMATKDPTQRAVYEKKIEAYDKQIEKITKTNEPLKYEIDEVTGNPINIEPPKQVAESVPLVEAKEQPAEKKSDLSEVADEVKVPAYKEVFKNGSKEDINQALKDVSDQWHDTNSRSFVEKNFPKEIVDAAKKEFPQEAPTEQSGKGSAKPIIEPSKPIAEMNSEELYNHAIETRKALNKQDKEFEGKTEKEKQDADYYDVVDNVEDLRDASTRVNFIENAENINEIAKSVRSILRKKGKGEFNEYDLSVLNAAQKRAKELGIDTNDLIKETVKSIGEEYKDKQDAEFMMSNALDKLIPKEKTAELPKQQSGKDVVVDEGAVDKPDETFYTGRKGKVNDFSTTRGDFIFFSKNKKTSEWYGGDESNITEAKLDTKNFIDLSSQDKKAEFVKENLTREDIEKLYKDQINHLRFDADKEKLITRKLEELQGERFSGDNDLQKWLLNKVKEKGYSGAILQDTFFGKHDMSYVVIDKSKIKQFEPEQSLSTKPEPVKNEEAKATKDTNTPTVESKEQPVVTKPALEGEAAEGGKTEAEVRKLIEEAAESKKSIKAKNDAMESEAAKHGEIGKKALKDIGGEPPIAETEPIERSGDKFKDKGILNRLYNAENIPEYVKEKLKEQGLKYEPQTREEAAKVAKGIVEQYGIDDAVTLAETARLKGGVNSAVFAEALNRLYAMEMAAKTPQEKLDFGKKSGEVIIRFDEAKRSQGRDISQIQHFYKNSPLGVKIAEETRRNEAFNEFAKKKEQSWKEFFNELKKEPEFESVVKEEVREELKKERAEARKARIKKVDDIFDKAKEQFKGGAAYSTIIPPKLITGALEGMKQAYHAGEKVAKVIEDAIEYISKEIGGGWDKEKFRKEWQDKLGEYESKKEIPLDKREKILEKFRKKLKGLSEKEKDEVIRRSFKKLVENGALEYADFKKIVGETLGYGELTVEQAKKITELVTELNSVDDLATKVRENERNVDALKKYQEAKKKAEKAATELGKMVYNKPDVVKRLLSVMQLNTLGIPSLINNPIFNVFNQSTVRLPRSIIMTGIDYGIYGVGKLFGKDYKPENNVFHAQLEFYNKLGYGSKQSVEQLLTGLTNRDYFQKEVYASQIKPLSSIRELWAYSKGDLKLTKEQVIDKTIQATVGVPAEVVARVLNIGDKPQRFAAEGAQAAVFAKNLGLQGIDYKLFMEFPKEEAYRSLKKQGLTDEVAMKKAEEIQQRIIKEGEESTFQENNMLNDALTAAFKPFGKAGEIVKTLNMPFVKIPLNAFWSVYNLANPEVALLQSAIYGYKAIKNKSAADLQNSKKWFAHAVTGMAWMAAVGSLAKAGIVNAPNPDDATKKEREGENYYEQQNSVNMSKLMAYMQGKNPDEVKNGLNVDLKWLGNMGILMGYQAQKLENMTPEQREKGLGFTEDMLSNLHTSALDFMDKGVFSNTGTLFTAINKGGSFMDNYLINLINMGTNIIQPAAFAQISRAQLPYYSKAKADTFLEQLKNNMLTRSSLLRNLTGQYPPSKIGIWGDKLEKKDNTIMRLFGISTSNDDNFAQPLYEDYKKTGNTKFFPPSVKPEIRAHGEIVKLPPKAASELEMLVGQERKKLVAPYVNDMATFAGSKKTYSELTDEEKTEKLNILYEEGFKNGKYLFEQTHPEYKIPEETKQEKKEKKKESRSNRVFRKSLSTNY